MYLNQPSKSMPKEMYTGLYGRAWTKTDKEAFKANGNVFMADGQALKDDKEASKATKPI